MTQISHTQARVSFHEATIVGMSHYGNTVDLTFDDVLIEGSRVSAEVALQGVRRTLRDGAPVETISMEQKDGEVLSLRQEGDWVLFVVQWNDYSNKHLTVVTYRLLGARIVLCPLGGIYPEL